VWLDPSQTSPYKLFQFWINTDDRDVGKYLRYFSLLSREEIEGLERAATDRPESREAQRALATEVTSRVHGAEAVKVATDASKLVFDKSADPRQFSAGVLETLMQELPSASIDLSTGTASSESGSTTIQVKGTPDNQAVDVLDAFVVTGLVKSKGDARRLLQQGGLYANGEKLSPDNALLSSRDAIAGGYYVLRKGARDMGIVRLSA
jgi:tyrosyl-tRNA synthetase